MYVCMYVCISMHICTCIRMHVHMYLYAYVCMYVFYAYMFMFMFVYVCVDEFGSRVSGLEDFYFEPFVVPCETRVFQRIKFRGSKSNHVAQMSLLGSNPNTIAIVISCQCTKDGEDIRQK